MKFQLFGRFRDNNDNNEESEGGMDVSGNPGMGNDPEMGDFGGGLQRTVEKMFSQGYSEEEVRQELQGQYPPERIRDAINQAVKSSATSDGNPEPLTPYQSSDQQLSPMDEGFDQDQQLGGNDNMEENRQEMEPTRPMDNEMNENMGEQRQPNVEELVETIVAENFNEVEREFENAYAEIDEMKDRLNNLEERVEELEIRDDEDQQEFIQKVDEMEEHIDKYQSRIGGLEKAFQQVLPSLVDNVRDLTNLVQEMKQEKGIETESEVSQENIQGLDLDEWD